MMINMAFRYLLGRKLRTFLTTLAVIFGVMVIFGMNILIPSIMQGFQANVMAAAGQVDLTITQKSGDSFNSQVADQVKSVQGVRAVSPSLNRTVNLPADFYDHDPAKADRVTALALVGVDPLAVKTVRSYIIQSGRFLQEGDTNSVVISQSLADALSLKTGSALSLPTTQGVVNLTVVGILPPRMAPGNEEIMVSLPEAQALADQAGRINALDIDLTSIDQVERAKVENNIKALLGDSYQFGAISAGGELMASVQLGQSVFNMFGVLALFMGGFIIFNTFRTVVAERRRDIGMLRAIGASRRAITWLILTEGLLQGVIGSVLGMLLGFVLGFGILKAISGVMNTFIHIQVGEPVVTPGLVVASLLLGVGVTVLAGLIPAVKAASVTPIEALRPSVAEVEQRRIITPGFIFGVILIAISLLGLFSQNVGLIAFGSFLLLGGLVLVAPALVAPIAAVFGKLISLVMARQGVGQLAEGNLSRQPSRAAITASTTMIGLAVIIAAGGITTSLIGTMDEVMHKTLGSDYLFVPPSIGVWSADIGAGSKFADQLRQVNGVGDISTFRFAGSVVNDVPVSMLGIDPVVFPKVSGLVFTEGNESAYQDIANGRALIVNSIFLTNTKTKMGDTIELQTPEGKQPYKIVAVAIDLINVKVTTAYISQANLKTDFGKTEDVFIQLNLKPGANREAVDAQIKSLAASYPQFTVISGSAYYEGMMQQLDSAFAGMYILLAFLSFPSMIAIMNTLAIGVIERTREIGMVCAVGGTRAQVHNMVVAEALLLAALGTAFGLAGGLYLGYALIAGIALLMPAVYSFPLVGVLLAIASGLIFGVLAALIPARQAARLEIIQALRYE